MAVKIRLTRMGAKKRPYYRLVVADSRAKRDGNVIESNWAQVFVNETEQDIPHIVLGDYLITPGKTFILGYTNEKDGILRILKRVSGWCKLINIEFEETLELIR